MISNHFQFHCHLIATEYINLSYKACPFLNKVNPAIRYKASFTSKWSFYVELLSRMQRQQTDKQEQGMHIGFCTFCRIGLRKDASVYCLYSPHQECSCNSRKPVWEKMKNTNYDIESVCINLNRSGNCSWANSWSF